MLRKLIMARENLEERRQIKPEWHLSIGFSLSLIGAILINCVTGVWYASQLNATIQQDHAAIMNMTAWKDKQDDEKSKTESHLSVIDEKLTEQSKSLDHIVAILEKK